MGKKTRRQRERGEDVRGSATDRAERGRGGVRPYLNLPKGVELFKFEKEGTKKIDVIEYITKNNPETKKGKRYFTRTFFIHKNIGPDGESHLCPKKTFGKPCAVCKARTKMASEPGDDDELQDTLKPKERQLFAIMDPKKKKKGIMVMDESYYLFGKELDAAVKKAKKKHGKEEADKFASPNEGLTVKCEVEEKSYKKATYTNVKMCTLVEREEQYDEDLLESVPCLDDCLVETPYKELKELFDQTKDDDDEDDDDSEDEDEDSDDEDSDDDSDDDEDESEDDDDDDDDDSDDDEDSEDEDDEDTDDKDEDEVEKGATVKFTYKDKKLKGKVLRIKNGLAHVKVKGRSDAYAIDPEDCKVV
jgi:hypothetical protein